MFTLEHLVAFNDEIIVLDRQQRLARRLGLDELGADVPDAIGQINATVAREMRDDDGLEAAVSRAQPKLPATYFSMIMAGLRCGRLTAGFECMLDQELTVGVVRRELRRALSYPLLVCVIAYLMFVFFSTFVAPQINEFMQIMELEATVGTNWVRWLQQAMPYWAAAPFVLLFVGLVLARTVGTGKTWSERFWSSIPLMNRISFDQDCAGMSELLARLVQQEVPRQEAVPLAAWATGNDEVVKAAQGLNEASGRTDEKVDAVLPPFLHWVLTSELEPEELQNALHVAADTYRFRSNRRVALLRGTLPIVACVVFAGGMTLVYGVTVFLPVVQMLYEMR